MAYSRIDGIVNEYATKDLLDRKLVLYTKLAQHQQVEDRLENFVTIISNESSLANIY